MEFELTPQEQDYLNRITREEIKLKELPIQSLGTQIERQASDRPSKIGLFYLRNSWTWDSINKECNRYANFFRNLGFKNGDTVSIMMENCPEYLFLTTGISKIQGINALINTHQRKRALIHAFNISTPKWIIVDEDCLPYLLEIKNELTIKSDRIFVCSATKNIKHRFRELDTESEQVSIENPNSTLNSNYSELK